MCQPDVLQVFAERNAHRLRKHRREIGLGIPHVGADVLEADVLRKILLHIFQQVVQCLVPCGDAADIFVNPA